MDPFLIKTSYKGLAGIADNLRQFRGYFDKGKSNGSMWVGATLKPLKKFENNFQVVSTDYDNYAILYTCTHLTTMYNRDSITVLVRQAPGIEEPSEELLNTIRDEFNKHFGGQKDNENEEAGGEEEEGEDSGAEEEGDDEGAEEEGEDEGDDAGAEDEKPDAEEKGAGQAKN